MAGVDEALQSVRTAIGMMRREQIRAVVPPAPGPRKLRDWHKFYGGDTELPQIFETPRRAIERSFGSESAYVQFVNDGRRKHGRPPSRVAPLEPGVVQDTRASVHAIRLPW